MVEIRKARKKDLDEIMKLVRQLALRWSSDYVDYWEKKGNKLLDLTYVALIKNRIVGYSLFHINKNSIYIADVYVSPKYRGKGIAMKLLAASENLKKRFKKKFVEVDVSKKNRSAYNLYKKLGFKVIGKKEKYDVLKLRK